jgi:anti-sigma-K factor RskA
MNHEDWLVQADIYALGALDGDDLVAFEAHLAAGCSECEDHIRKTREALTLLPRALESIAPPPTVRARVLAQIAAEAAIEPSVTPLPRRRWWMGVGALVAAGLLLALSFTLYQTRQEVQHLQTQVASLQTSMAEREEALQAGRRELQRANGGVPNVSWQRYRASSTSAMQRFACSRPRRCVWCAWQGCRLAHVPTLISCGIQQHKRVHS